ncbi:MAG: DUF5671 domain-containing protein [Rhodanobacteraceae bacterium]|nr:DUF5671 domain-containing protein [Pseudomonadota bacterium]
MASSAQELEQFVRDALLRGSSRQSIGQALTNGGWTPEQAKSALAAYADVEFPVPVPKARAYPSAREAFLYLILYTTLYLSAYNFGSLLFDLINRAFPDPAMMSGYYTYILQSIRWEMASIVIAFPVFLFLFLSAKVGRELRQQPVKRLSAVRRWLTYLTLFIAADVLIGDLITLVYNVLGGEITVRFILKVIVTGAIAGVIFGYYLWGLRRDERVA